MMAIKIGHVTGQSFAWYQPSRWGILERAGWQVFAVFVEADTGALAVAADVLSFTYSIMDIDANVDVPGHSAESLTPSSQFITPTTTRLDWDYTMNAAAAGGPNFRHQIASSGSPAGVNGQLEYRLKIVWNASAPDGAMILHLNQTKSYVTSV